MDEQASDQSQGGPVMRPIDRIWNEVQLPRATAAWVLFAHAFTLLAPLTVLWAVHACWDSMQQRMHAPVFFYVGVALLLAGSAFEFAQNTIDKWYLTPETPSAEGHGLCDLLFYTLIGSGLGCYAYAAAGEFVVVPILSIAAVVLFVYLYLTGRPPYAGLAIAGWTTTLALFYKLGDPVLFLQLICGTGMTRYFFAALLRTDNQVLHGFTTIGNALGMLAVPWAIVSVAAGEPNSVWTAAAIVLASAVLGVTLWKPLSRLAPTVRRLPSEPQSIPPSGAVDVAPAPAR